MRPKVLFMMLQIRPDGVAHFAPVRVVHIVPESLVHYAPVEVVHYTPVCSTDYSKLNYNTLTYAKIDEFFLDDFNDLKMKDTKMNC